MLGRYQTVLVRNSYWKDTKLDYYLIDEKFLPFPFNAEVTMSMTDAMDIVAIKIIVARSAPLCWTKYCSFSILNS